MSFARIKGALSLADYENADPLPADFKNLVGSQDLLLQVPRLVKNVRDGKDVCVSCLVLEAMIDKLDDLVVQALWQAVVETSAPLEDEEYDWDLPPARVVQHRLEVLYKWRLMKVVVERYSAAMRSHGGAETIDLDVATDADVNLSADTVSGLVLLLVYHCFDQVPWSNEAILSISLQLLACFSPKTVESSILPLATSLLTQLAKLNKFNSTLMRRNDLMKNLNVNIGFFRTSTTELETWKLHNSKLLSVVKYLIVNLPLAHIRLIVPLLLNFVDDHKYPVKIISCSLVADLIDSGAGLANYQMILQESLDKCLLCLPPVTPVDQSFRLLQITYELTLKLWSLLPEYKAPVVALVQDHLIPTMIQVLGKSFEIMQLTLDLLLDRFLPILEADLIAVLPQLVPQLLNILTDPYTLSGHALIRTDIRVLTQICRYCWPIMDKYQFDCLAAIAMCGQLAQSEEEVQLALRDLCVVMSACCRKFESGLKTLVLAPQTQNLQFLLS